MIDRLQFIGGINGIKYPQMLVDFFDHFIALKEIVQDSGKVAVENNNESSIIFRIDFKSDKAQQKALQYIINGQVIIYNRPIYVNAESLSESSIRIILQ